MPWVKKQTWHQACDLCDAQRPSARSARQHKAWGVSPRIAIEKCPQPAEWATAESPLRVTRLWDSTSVARLRGLQTN